MALTDQLMQQQAGPNVQQGVREGLAPYNEGPVQDFLIELMAVTDDVGALDASFQQPTVEDQMDEQDPNADPMEVLNESQLMSLVNKFLAIPEPERVQIEQILREALPPQVVQRLEAVVRFAQQRGAGQGVI